MRILLRAGPEGTLAASLPPAAAGGWCRLGLRLPPGLEAAVAQLGIAAETALPAAPIPLAAPRRGGRTRRAIAFLPVTATDVRLHLFADPAAAPAQVRLRCIRLSRPMAALALAASVLPHLAATLLRGLLRAPRSLPGRLRAELSAGAATGTLPDGPAAYALWIRLFDRHAENGLPLRLVGAESERPVERDGSSRSLQDGDPSIAVLVLHAASASAALAASLDAAAIALAACGPPAAGMPTGPIAVGPAGVPLDAALAAATGDYLALLQAGEVVPPHALSRLARQAAALGLPAILYADEDRLGPDGVRCDPLFKPAPSHTLMLSGALATGLWLIRRDLLASSSCVTLPCAAALGWAETLRLDAWLRLYEAGGAATSHRIPSVLTHRRADAETAPADALAAVAQAHCARTGLPARIRPARPLEIRLAAPPTARPWVSLIVPSACRAAHVAACLTAVLARTDYAELELVLVLTGAGPPDRAQRRLLRRLAADPRVHPVLVTAPAFNFAAACNQGAAAARGELLCLLNDDVAPRDPGWLAVMAGHLADPAVGVVGARLLYPDGAIQHAGVVLCPDGTGVHCHRFLLAGAAGYGGRARLAQEYAAVTGACLLTRRSLWERLGGLDEAFASAFNDVDFCLRARETGAGVVLAAEAELTHAESRSFGRHYGLDEAARNHADRARLLARFPAAFRADPFHSPNLSPWHGDGRALRFPPGPSA